MEPSEGRQPLPLGEALGALLLEAMRYAMDVRVQSKDDLMPGMMIELEDGQKTIVMFPEGNVELGRAELRNGTSKGRKIERAVLFWEAWVTLEAEREEAVMFEAHEQGTASGVLTGQRYRRRFLRTPQKWKNPFFLGPVASLLGIASP